MPNQRDATCLSGGSQMSSLVISWIITTIAILVAAHIIPGIRADSLGGALLGAAILGILNAVLKPIFVILTLPITLVTFGLFLFVINALIFWLAGSLLSGFHVQSFWAALLGSLVVTIVSYLANSIRF
jgi:putative membrane protein